MKRQGFCAVHDQVGAIIKWYSVPRQQCQGALLSRGRHSRVNSIDLDRIRRLTLQTQDDRFGRAMTGPRCTERAKELSRHAATCRHESRFIERQRKHSGGAHRANRMRTGGADTHLEEVKGTE